MRLSRLSRHPTTTLLNPLLIFILTITLTCSTYTNANANGSKRDLLGNLLPLGGSPSSPPSAATPAGPPAPTTPGGAADGSKPNSTTTGALPGLISHVLNPPPILGSIGSAPLSTTGAVNPKMHPSAPAPAPGAAKDPANGDDEDGDESPASPSQTLHSKDGNNSGADGSALSPGLIALLVVVLLAVLAGVLFSCYRVRQSRRRRHQSWNEDILKNHAGSVGYSETGGGYGMYVGSGGSSKERPDLWRKNLDLFHRE
ncbi:hypothetical protein EC991_000661 [Linnemannia zychae]|nr:hypothetical protein EC991_000661 [Linnemannia zychae]